MNWAKCPVFEPTLLVTVAWRVFFGSTVGYHASIAPKQHNVFHLHIHLSISEQWTFSPKNPRLIENNIPNLLNLAEQQFSANPCFRNKSRNADCANPHKDNYEKKTRQTLMSFFHIQGPQNENTFSTEWKIYSGWLLVISICLGKGPIKGWITLIENQDLIVIAQQSSTYANVPLVSC